MITHPTLADVTAEVTRLRAALDYELRLARKQIELIKDRGMDCAITRSFGSQIWQMSKRIEKALGADEAVEHDRSGE